MPRFFRLSVTTQPLDVVYNPAVFQQVTEFFSQDSSRAQSVLIERQLREVARVRYEELKSQTKAELVNTLDSMMRGDLVRALGCKANRSRGSPCIGPYNAVPAVVVSFLRVFTAFLAAGARHRVHNRRLW